MFGYFQRFEAFAYSAARNTVCKLRVFTSHAMPQHRSPLETNAQIADYFVFFESDPQKEWLFAMFWVPSDLKHWYL